MNFKVLAICLIGFVTIFKGTSSGQACNLTGTYTIGTGGNYPNINTAVSDLENNGIGGSVILEITSAYQSTDDTFPVVINAIPCSSPTKTVTIRPASGTTVTISSLSVMFSFGGANYVTFDGRAGGTGTTSALNLICYGSPAFYFVNSGSNNTVRYVNIESSSQSNGVISFLNSSATTGNQNNLIEYCTIGALSGSRPLNCIYSLGSAGKKNNNNTIRYCEFRDFLGCGIDLESNSTDFTILGNSFITGFSFNATGIHINDTTSSGFQITDNFIGGSDVQCGGTPAELYQNFTGIRMAVGNSGSDVDGNVISNIKWANSFGTDMFIGIHLIAGKIRCGTINGNTIGSDTAFGSIHTYSYYLTEPEVSGILVGYPIIPGTPDSMVIANNKIGGIFCLPDSNNYEETRLYGIYVKNQTAGHVTIEKNFIGSHTVPRSMYSEIFIGSYGTKAIQVENFTTAVRNYIEENTIENIHGATYAIDINGGLSFIHRNRISHLTGGGMVGIRLSNCNRTTVVTRNTISNFVSDLGVVGIEADLITGTEISKNFIHTFQAGTNYDQYGIFLHHNSGFTANKVTNNMIRLGIDSAGNNITMDNTITGIQTYFDSTLVAFNSVYIDGSNQLQSAALIITDVEGSGNRATNNILVNRHTSTGGNFYNNYGVLFPNFQVNVAIPLTLDYNIYQQGGNLNYTGGDALFNPVGYASLADWQARSGMDLQSQDGAPNFINATGNVNSVDLHIQLPSIADATGVVEPGVSYDFDNDLRSTHTPVDIGADAIDATTAAVTEMQSINVSIYPNPVSGNLTIQIGREWDHVVNYSLQVENVFGQLIYKSRVNDVKEILNTKEWNSTGIHLLRMIDNDGKIVYSKKIIVVE